MITGHNMAPGSARAWNRAHESGIVECSICEKEIDAISAHDLKTDGESACEHCATCCTGCAEWFPNDAIAEDGVTIIKHFVFVDRLSWCAVCVRSLLDEMYAAWRVGKKAMCDNCGSYPAETARFDEGDKAVGYGSADLDLCGICARVGGTADAIRQAEEWLQSLPLEQGREGRECGPVPPPLATRHHARAGSPCGELRISPSGPRNSGRGPVSSEEPYTCPF